MQIMNGVILLGALVFDDVADGDDSDQAVLFDDRQVSDSFLAHDRAALSLRCISTATGHRRGHDIYNERLGRGTLRGHDPVEYVTLRKNPDHLVVASDNQCPDTLLVHERGGFQYSGVGVDGGDRATFLVEDVLNGVDQ